MKFASICALSLAAASTSAMAVKLECGIYENGADKPTATTIYDTDTRGLTKIEGKDYLGIVTMPQGDQPILVVGVRHSSGGRVGGGVYPVTDSTPIGILVNGDKDSGVVVCSPEGKALAPVNLKF